MSEKTIQIKSGTANPTSLLTSELALNKTTSKLFTSTDGSNIIDLAGSSYAKLDTPAFSGNPTCITQAIRNNSTRLANTAFVHRSHLKNNINQYNNSNLIIPSIDGIYIYTLTSFLTVSLNDVITDNSEIGVMNTSPDFQMRILNSTLDIYLNPFESVLLIGDSASVKWYPMFYNTNFSPFVGNITTPFYTNSFYSNTNRIINRIFEIGNIATNTDVLITTEINWNKTILSYSGFVIANVTGLNYALPTISYLSLGPAGLYLNVAIEFGAGINRGRLIVQYADVTS